MKKTTSNNLSNRIAQYGALSLAMAGIMDANGQIIYTDVDPDSAGTTSLNNVPILIDLDNDGTHEFDLRLKYTVGLYINPNSLITGASVLGNPLGGSSDNYQYPFALNKDYTISSLNTSWMNNQDQILVYNNCSYTGSDYNQWCNLGGEDRYLGLRFQIAGATHYGWARLSVTDLPNNWILLDYAYNSAANEPINAGQTVLGLQESSLNKTKIIALNKTIALHNLPPSTNYRLFNIAGQKVLEGKTNQNTYVIEANTQAKGIYIIEVMDQNSKAVIRKKIVL